VNGGDPGVALVTGGSRGIGRAIVRALARKGARVHFTYLRDRSRAEETAGQVRERGGIAELSQLDVSDEDAVQAWSRSVLEREARIDILVNNAGETVDGLLAFQETADWRRVLAVNLDGTRHVCRAVLRTLIEQRRGRIVNLSSVSALMGLEGQTAYAAAKGGVIAFTRSLAREAAPFGVTVNALVPGPVETEMWEALGEERRAALLSQVPMGRAATPEEVAAAAIYLATEASSYVTGTALRVDGGLSM
jgi:3-oxoacyl-[acyl-carrier protein] reductase